MRLLRHIPNTLTCIRISLAIPLGLWLWEGKILAALGLLLVAGVTDLLDGYLAREFGWRTVLGAWLDPTADKILIATSLVTMTVKTYIPLWFCFVIIGRDLGLVVAVSALVWSGTSIKIQPLLSGKLAVTLQNLALLIAMLQPVFAWPKHALPTLLVISTLATVVSSAAYAKTLISYRKRAVRPSEDACSPTS